MLQILLASIKAVVVSPRWPKAVYAGIVLISGANCSPAVAATVCISCQSPDAQYACIVDDALNASSASLVCIEELARRNGHASCRAGTKAQPPCPGLAVALQPAVGQTAPLLGANAPAAPSEPGTLLELGDQVAKNSSKQLEQAGRNVDALNKTTAQALGQAAQSTWNCLASLFTNCN
jgi:hypothetical protein